MQNKAWVVAVDMGYGHQRAAYPLRFLSPYNKVLLANSYNGIPKSDQHIWDSSQKFYEFFSRSKNIPLIGDWLFDTFIDRMQRIQPFYPRRDLSKPNFQLRLSVSQIKGGWGKDLINYLNKVDIPLITTFFAVAFMAEEHGFKNDIYVVICDSDISRAWAPLHPKHSRIKYLTPNRRATERLKLYGVKKENIILTGFPLPDENLGGKDLKTLRKDLAERIVNLDPERRFRQKHMGTIKTFLRGVKMSEKHNHSLTLTFAVGGAGAQKNIAIDILRSLRKKLLENKIKLNLVAGTRFDVSNFFSQSAHSFGLGKLLGKNIKIIFESEKENYFKELNEALRTTDILWTKPSEMVFYSALGLPIIMAPALGSQEIYNKIWLKTVGAGISQEDPKYTSEWLFDWVNSGWLAEAALDGFLDARQFGVHNIMKAVFNGVCEPAKNYQLL